MTTIDDDDTMLEAALAFIDEFHDGTIAAKKTYTGANINVCGRSSRAKNDSRDRQKREIVRLRAEAEELETCVRHLRAQRREGSTLAVTEDSGGIKLSKAQLALLWKDMAWWNYQLRQESEAENERLRGQLATQLKITKELDKIFRKQAFTTNGPRTVRCQITLDMNDIMRVSHELVEVLTFLYLDTDRVFAANNLDNKVLPFTDKKIQQRTPTRTEIEIIDAMVLPFAFMNIGETFWHKRVTRCEHNTCIFVNDVDGSGNTMSRMYAVEHEQNGVNVTLHGHHIFRRYIEQERYIIVHSGRIYLDRIENKPVSGIEVNVKWWLVIHRPDASQPNVSVQQTCAQITMDIAHHIPNRTKVAAMLTEFIVNRLTKGSALSAHLLLGSEVYKPQKYS